MSQRIQERLHRLDENYRIVNREFIDQFTTVIDTRTTEEVLSREPKCVVAHRMKKEQKMKELKDDVQKLVAKVATFCTDCNPGKGVLLCKATGCIAKKLYGLLIEGLCFFDEEEENE